MIRALAHWAGAALVLASLVVPWIGARALIVETGDAPENSVAPVDDPGWANVGFCGGWTAVYLGGGWVLTARHVGVADLILDGKSYAAIPETRKVIPGSGGTHSDLIVYRVDPEPGLPTLFLSKSPPEIGDSVVMIGRGRGRGDPLKGNYFNGFLWNSGSKMQWGTATVSEYLDVDTVGSTKAFATRFSIAKTRHEAQAARGDSGGAAFARGVERWELAGIILAIKGYHGQPPNSAVYGNRTVIADLAYYRETIHRITGLSEQ